jgi:archaellum component FlaG (FlaF/FlaG flagellin family)
MPFPPSFQLPASRIARAILAAIALASVSVVVSSFHRKPRAWTVAEVPIAFWAWRTQSPTEADVRAVIEEAQARTIFLRAGQIDYQNGKLRRIRPLTGSFPRGIDLHLVYNATRSLLAQLESVDEQSLAAEIGRAYREDSERAVQEDAYVVGLQVDIDVPTRLLPRYRKTLSALRRDLQSGNQLSITGLPTWMDSTEIDDVLEQVDFWIPQFYGAEVPERSDQIIPISSPQSMVHFVSRARELDSPFYAGLAAYSWVLLYSASGSLISLRGDMNLAEIAAAPNLELIDQRSFDDHATSSATGSSAASEWRYAFRARAGGVTDGLAMHTGDLLVVDVPNAGSLRQAARTVRQLAGKKLLGICVFRLPERDDPATLTVEQVASALADQDSMALIDVRIRRDPPTLKTVQTAPDKLILEVKNVGTASALMDSLQIDIAVQPGSFEALTSESLALVETMCQGPAAASSPAAIHPCSQRRANVIRLRSKVLTPGQTLRAVLTVNRHPALTIRVTIAMQTDAGQSYSSRRELSVESEVKQ